MDALRHSAHAVIAENHALRAQADKDGKAARHTIFQQTRDMDSMTVQLTERVNAADVLVKENDVLVKENTVLMKENAVLVKENAALRAEQPRPPWMKPTGELAAMGMMTAALVMTAAEGSLLTFKGFMGCLPAIGLALNSVQQAKLVPMVVLVIAVAAMSLTQSAFVTVNVEEATQGTMKTCAQMLTKLAEAQCSRDKLGSSLGCVVSANLGQHIPCNATLKAPQAASCDPQKLTACASGAGPALQDLGLDTTTFFTADQAAQIFQRADELLKTKLARFPGLTEPPRTVFGADNPASDVDGDAVLSVPELLSAIPQLYSTDTLRECAAAALPPLRPPPHVLPTHGRAASPLVWQVVQPHSRRHLRIPEDALTRRPGGRRARHSALLSCAYMCAPI